MRFVQLPTVFDVTDPELEKLGMGGQQIEDGVIYVNPTSIDIINPSSDENETTISVSGVLIRICMPFAEVVRRLGLELSV